MQERKRGERERENRERDNEEREREKVKIKVVDQQVIKTITIATPPGRRSANTRANFRCHLLRYCDFDTCRIVLPLKGVSEPKQHDAKADLVPPHKGKSRN